jgi:hypothetical protein
MSGGACSVQRNATEPSGTGHDHVRPAFALWGNLRAGLTESSCGSCRPRSVSWEKTASGAAGGSRELRQP